MGRHSAPDPDDPNAPAEPAPTPAERGPVEAKVAYGSAAAFITGLLAAVAAAVVDHRTLLEALPIPTWIVPLVVAVLPAIAAFVAGYSAPHTTRPDLTPGWVPLDDDGDPEAGER